MLNWIAGVIVFWAGVYAIFRIWISSAETQAKILWTLLVALLPLLGFIIWWFAGPKDRA
ncbi:MAG: hypothetical protein CSA72_10770 [Rhodobacterales bacterium]|nr:MAG: hypothetical protein CSA72_10770 [Rhodobacterales bacterium]